MNIPDVRDKYHLQLNNIQQKRNSSQDSDRFSTFSQKQKLRLKNLQLLTCQN